MNKKYLAGALVALLIVGGGSFYAGSLYAKSSQGGARSGAFTGGQFSGTSGNRTFRGSAGGFSGGTVIAKDATSLTVKGTDGSTKIILTGTNTQVMKTAAGTLDDVSVGTTVSITGSANADGSITAETISLRPAPRTTTAAQ